MRGFRALCLLFMASLCSGLGCRPNDKEVKAIVEQVMVPVLNKVADQTLDQELPRIREAARPLQSIMLAKATFGASPLSVLSGISFVTTCVAFDDLLHSQFTSSGLGPFSEGHKVRVKKILNAGGTIPLFTPTSTAPLAGR